jgi:hypothetical protein
MAFFRARVIMVVDVVALVVVVGWWWQPVGGVRVVVAAENHASKPVGIAVLGRPVGFLFYFIIL